MVIEVSLEVLLFEIWVGVVSGCGREVVIFIF